jgi:hypothetical protein
MKSLNKTVVAVALLLSATFYNAQIKNSKTENVKISGTVECANQNRKSWKPKNTATVDWDKQQNSCDYL